MEQTLLYIITATAVITCICVILTLILVLTSFGDMKKKLEALEQKCSQGSQNRNQSDILKGKTELLGEMKTAIAAAVAEQMKHEQKQILSAVQATQTAAPVQAQPAQTEPEQQMQPIPQTDSVQESAAQVSSRRSVARSEKKESGEDLEQTLLMPKIELEKRGSILCRKCYKPYPSTERECPYCKAKQQ